jgi:hypothetical protein
MNGAKKIFLGVLFTFGFIFLLVTAANALKSNPTKEEKSAALGGLLLGVPPTALGIWMILDARRHSKAIQQNNQLQVESIFLQLLQANKGRITMIDFAIASKLPLAEAKQYLDQKARELNANFEVTEDGGVNYRFPLL